MIPVRQWVKWLAPFGADLQVEVANRDLTFSLLASECDAATLDRPVVAIALVVAGDDLYPPATSPAVDTETPAAAAAPVYTPPELADWAPGELTEGFGS